MKRELYGNLVGAPQPSRRALLFSGAAVCLAGASTPLWSTAAPAAASSTKTFRPETFGAKGDGKTDDSAAFRLLNAALAASGGGIVELRADAVYVAGAQTPAGPYLRNGTPILVARAVPLFIVRMNGATIKFRDGLMFGSFDARTGRPKPQGQKSLNPMERADIGYAILAENVAHFAVSGGTIDGNSRGAVLGGSWGDTGRQCIHYGIGAYNCDKVDWADLKIVDSCLDGLVYGHARLTRTPAPLRARRVMVDRVGRNCVSLVSTNDTLFEDCTFANAGAAQNPAGLISSAPASCFDVEAEQGICRNVVIRRTRLASGATSNTSFVADSGPSSDILLDDCQIDGPLWTSKPRTVFRNCRINGPLIRILGDQEKAQDNTRIEGCQVTDNPRHPINNLIDLEGAGPGVRITGTSFTTTFSRLNFRGGLLTDVTINFATGTDKLEARDFAILMDNARLNRVVINDRIPAGKRPTDAYYITSPASASDAIVVSPASKIMWRSWSPGAGGHTGRYREN